MFSNFVACIVRFDQPTHIVNENEELEIGLSISPPPQNLIDVLLIGIDPPRNELRIPAGATSAIFVLAPTDDNICEDDEIFNLEIDESSLPAGCVVGDPASTMVTIVDDDGE